MAKQVHLDSVVPKGEAKKVKKTWAEKASGAFSKEDFENVAKDVLWPGVKDVIVNVLTTTINLIFYGDARGGGRRISNNNTARGRIIDYGARYASRSKEPLTGRPRPTYEYEEVWLKTRPAAQNVIDGIFDAIEKNDIFSVGNLYELAGYDPIPTDFEWGWDDVSSASIVPRDDGFVIKMARPRPVSQL